MEHHHTEADKSKKSGLLSNKMFWLVVGAACFVIIGFIIPTPQSLIELVEKQKIAEKLIECGKELGVYTDPMDYFGALNAELWRSIRLVADTGIHAKGWTRQQVLDYMYANAAVSETRAVSEAERFMAIPGQALAYKIGMLKIREIRADAEARLGDKFDVRDFHTQILIDGPMPLSMLETKIDRWVASPL